MSPVVLGIDTSGSWCSAALLRGREIHVRRADVGNGHSDALLSMIAAVLDEGGVLLGECEALAFSAGPGSFTGLRVGCAVAQGLAFGAAVDVAPIGTLDAIAQSVDDLDPGASHTILVAQDARMGEVYWSRFERSDGGLRALTEPALCSPRQLRAILGTGSPIDIGCGNAWSVHADAMDGLVRRVVPREAADAVDVARLGAIAAREGRLVPPRMASLVYVRDHVALTTSERASLAREKAVSGAIVEG